MKLSIASAGSARLRCNASRNAPSSHIVSRLCGQRRVCGGRAFHHSSSSSRRSLRLQRGKFSASAAYDKDEQVEYVDAASDEDADADSLGDGGAPPLLDVGDGGGATPTTTSGTSSGLSTLDDASLLVAGSSSDADDVNPYGGDGAAGNTQAAIRPLSAPLAADGSGSPALEALLAEAAAANNGSRDAAAAAAPVSLERLEAIFPFALDSFQRKAVSALLEGKNVVVCAPTGAGKTAIAEAAAAATLAAGRRVIYTTPLKALSNQKLLEARARFGTLRCGLQTGDTSLNPDGAVVVMTTEILRNIMYRTAETAGPSSGGATRDERLGDVGLIVLDEVHYLGDPGRGSVWEEVIINCPRHVLLLAMSATVRNPDDLGGWISQEHGECVTVRTRFRPVPLRWMFCHSGGGPRGAGKMVELLDSAARALNPALSMERLMRAEARRILASGRAAAAPGEAAAAERALERQLRRDALRKRVMMRLVPTSEQVAACLRENDMLPAIWFILSRQGCDQAAIAAGLAEPLTTAAERAGIQAALDELSAESPESVRTKFVPALLNGVAAHHAGCLPGWKGLVERCFQRGLVKLVFATGTLAAGINMPARTTVISSLARRTDEGIQLLPHNELLQMAGRAGRRGYDTRGNCVLLPTRFEGAEAGARIIAAGPEPLRSQFAAGYGMVLNLLSAYTLEDARAFLSRSFGQYMSGAGSTRRLKEIAELEAEAAALLEAKPGGNAAAEAGGNGGSGSNSGGSDVNAPPAAAVLAQAQARVRELNARARLQRCASVEAATAGEGRLPALVLLNLAQSDAEPPQLLPAMAVGVVASEADTPMAEVRAKDLEMAAAAARAASGQLKGGGTGKAAAAAAAATAAAEAAAAAVATNDGSAAPAAAAGALFPSKVHTPLLFCLGADNRLMVVSAAQVVGMAGAADAPLAALEAELTAAHAATWARMATGGWRGETPSGRLWANQHKRMYSCQVCPGGARTQAAALALNVPPDVFAPVGIDEELLADVRAAHEALRAAKEADRLARRALRAQRAAAKRGAAGAGGASANGDESSGSGSDDSNGSGSGSGSPSKAAAAAPKSARACRLQAERLLYKAARLRDEVDEATAATWKDFLGVAQVLEDCGALEPGTRALQPLGLLARSLQGQNELWMAIALSHPAVLALNGPQLAAYVAALVCSEVIRRPMSVWTPYAPSAEVLTAVEELEPAREALFEAQTAAGMYRWNESLAIDLRFAGIVEAWASGAGWADVMADVELDDGDMARLLARTVDVLRQAVFLGHLLPYLVAPAREALRGMDRKPISDLAL